MIKIKILLISNMYPSIDAPNYGIFVKNTELILKESGFDIDRIVMYKTRRKAIKLLKYTLYYLRIISTLLFKNYDVVYVHYAAHNAPALLISKALKRNLIIYTNVHGSDVVPESEFSSRLQKYVRRLLEISNKIITPSQYYRNLVIDKYELDRNRVYVFPSGGINENIFYRIDNKSKLYSCLGLDENVKYIGYVGRIDYKKGWETVLEAVCMLKKDGLLADKKLIVVGSGKQEKLFDSKVQEYGLKEDIIHFNMLPQNKLNEIYNCLELFCFPTMRKGESLGLVGLEAMACGVPVIGSKIGGLQDYIIDGQNGLFFEPGNSVMLKDKIVEYLNYSDSKKQYMKQQAFKTSCRYRVQTVKETLINIFKDFK